jgi:hypothetical protein
MIDIIYLDSRAYPILKEVLSHYMILAVMYIGLVNVRPLRLTSFTMRCSIGGPRTLITDQS